MKIPVVQAILSANESQADDNRQVFDATGVYAVNLMGSPGAGKTSLILATVARLPQTTRPGVIEGDLASTIDAETMARHGLPVVQINTGGNCHLDAPQIQSALPHLPLPDLDLLFIENVGNLVCTANFALGAHLAVVVASVPEGHDKPYKYPGIYATADVVVLNKRASGITVVLGEGQHSMKCELTPTRNALAYAGNVMGREIVYERSREQVQADIDRLNPAVREYRR